jgi:hypothetical protein
LFIFLFSANIEQVNKRKETLEAKRERKAAKTLAIITGMTNYKIKKSVYSFLLIQCQ